MYHDLSILCHLDRTSLHTVQPGRAQETQQTILLARDVDLHLPRSHMAHGASIRLELL